VETRYPDFFSTFIVPQLQSPVILYWGATTAYSIWPTF